MALSTCVELLSAGIGTEPCVVHDVGDATIVECVGAAVEAMVDYT